MSKACCPIGSSGKGLTNSIQTSATKNLTIRFFYFYCVNLTEKVGKSLAIYLGSAWVIMEASNFFIDRYDLEPLLLDVLIILIVFGAFITIIYKSFNGRWNKKAIVLQAFIVIGSLVFVGYFVTNPANINPRALRFIKIGHHQNPLEGLESVAVLPIQNNLPNSENDYLLAGLHDGIITELGTLGTLKTISRTTMLQYAKSTKTLKSIGKELGVNALLESSLSASNDEFILRFRLIEAKSEDLIWSDEFTTTISRMPSLSETISKIIAISLNPNMEESRTIDEEVNPKAYIEVVKGNTLLGTFQGPQLRESLTHFHKAIAIDSSHIEGYLGVARAWSFLQQMGAVDPKVARPIILKYGQLAKEIDPNHWQTHAYEGNTLYSIAYDFRGGIESYLKSLQLNPNNSEVRILLAHSYMNFGEWDKAWDEMRYAKEIDPLNPKVIGMEFIMYGSQGKFLSVMKSMKIMEAIDPDNFYFTMFSLITNRDLGNDEEAIQWLKKFFGGDEHVGFFDEVIDQKYQETNNVNDAWYACVRRAIELDNGHYNSSWIARTLYSFIPGYDDDLFFKHFQILANDRHPDMPYYYRKDGNPLQDDPRFIKIMEDIGLW